MGSYRNTYEVLIASPSDLPEERSKIVRAICEWNYENADKGIAFSPLLWEWNAASNFDKTPQEAINEQLLSRADFLIAAFKGRMGTKTKDYPAGTIEELSKRTGRAAVFFPKVWPPVNDTEGMKQLTRLIKFYEKVSDRFPMQYENPDDLLRQVKITLADWAKGDVKEIPLHLSLFRGGPCDPEKLLLQAVPPKGKKAYILLYNTELSKLKTREVFEEFWGFLRDKPWVEKVILLLPSFKVERLKAYLADPSWAAGSELLERFFVSHQRVPDNQEELRMSFSLAFALLRYGNEPTQGAFAPITQFAFLAEPFSSPQKSSRGGSDVEWDYKYYFEFSSGTQLPEKLGEVWNNYWAQDESLTKVSELAGDNSMDQSDINHFHEERIKRKRKEEASPGKGDSKLIDSNVILIKELKHKLFDPNVPSYLLNPKYDLLDWNNAFELVFPTTKFYRHEDVKKFVDCLDSKDEAKRRGKELIQKEQNDQIENPRFDLEQLTYCSPKYGVMNFTKIASKVMDPQSGEPNGWIVALNVNQVENLEGYELDLRLMNERQALIGEFALYFDRVLGHFDGYIELVARSHARALSLYRCRNILDLGCGPGIVSEELLKSGMRVTAIDQNDAMLNAARERCKGFRHFSSVKANIETLHKRDPKYTFEKVGIKMSYDGAALHNGYYWLSDPQSLLRRLADERLLDPNGLLTISLLTSKNDATELLEAIQFFKQSQEEEQGEDVKIWSDSDFDGFSNGLDKLLDQKGSKGVIGRYSEEDVAGHLTNAGYEIIKRDRPVYKVQGRSFSPFAFFVARLKGEPPQESGK